MGYDRKLTSKSQVTVPKDVRDFLAVKPGEAVRFDIDGKTVTLKRADPAVSLNERRAKLRAGIVRARAISLVDEALKGVDGMTYQRMVRASPEL